MVDWKLPHSKGNATELEAQRAGGNATVLVNALSLQLQNGRVEVPDFLRLSDSFGKFYAPASDQAENCPDEGGCP